MGRAVGCRGRAVARRQPRRLPSDRGALRGGPATFGRRGDRYDVVSSFAARLESTRRVEEQLPALAGAVVETFKVPFVRVEVVTPSGGTVAAAHGEPDGDAQQLDIGYRDERIGRLVLPRRGLRSMLSRRDQALLVNLALFGRERFAPAQLFEDVVHAGHGQAGMELLLAFAVGVERDAPSHGNVFSFCSPFVVCWVRA